MLTEARPDPSVFFHNHQVVGALTSKLLGGSPKIFGVEPTQVVFPRIREHFIACFLVGKTAYRRANGGSTAPTLHVTRRQGVGEI